MAAASVQNRYNFVDRASEDVLNHCAQHAIGFIPWYPLAAGDLVKAGCALDSIAKRHGATAGQVALAWPARAGADGLSASASPDHRPQ